MRLYSRCTSAILPAAICLFLAVCIRALASDAGEGEIHRDILNQVDFALRAGVSPITVVTDIDGIQPVSSESSSTGTNAIALRGDGVVYVGEEILPPGTTVGLFRALLVEKSLLYEWIDNGTIVDGVWQSFWKYYSVEFSSDDDGESSSWMALPVGDVEKGPDVATWWVQGRISQDMLDEAVAALNAKILVDWRRLAAGSSGQLLMFNAHKLNEPSAGGQIGIIGELLDQEEENISHLTGSGCSPTRGSAPAAASTGRSTDSAQPSDNEGLVRFCGAAFEAKTSRNVYPGDQLVWCYGRTYERKYRVAQTCLADDTREIEDH